MLNYAIIFFIIAIVAAFLGFSGIAGSAAGIAQILFFICLVIAAQVDLRFRVCSRSASRPQPQLLSHNRGGGLLR